MKRFNPEKELNKIRNGNKKKVIISICTLLLIIGIGSTYALYQVRHSNKLVYTTVKEFKKRDIYLSVLVDGKPQGDFPKSTEGKIYSGIDCDNKEITEATWNYDSWKLELSSTGPNKCTIEFITKPKTKEFKDIIKANGTNIFADGTVDNNLRYVGADPSNYIYFNCDDYNNPTSTTCELWRIIGLMNNVKSSKGVTNLVKITRTSSIGSYSFDVDNNEEPIASLKTINNDWTTSELMYILNPNYENHKISNSYVTSSTIANNSLYWNRKDGNIVRANYNVSEGNFSTIGIKNNTKPMIETVTWDLGGVSTISNAADYYGNFTASSFYAYERGANVYQGNESSWTGKIALPYVSDYLYSPSGNSSTNRNTCLETINNNWDKEPYKTGCADTAWLGFSGVTWYLTSIYNANTAIFYRLGSGRIQSRNVDGYFSVHPTLYLTSNVVVVDNGNDGSIDHPYNVILQ